MKISYQMGYASSYVYRQVIRAETEAERDDMVDFLMKNDRYFKHNNHYMEGGLTALQKFKEEFGEKRIVNNNTIYIFKGENDG